MYIYTLKLKNIWLTRYNNLVICILSQSIFLSRSFLTRLRWLSPLVCKCMSVTVGFVWCVILQSSESTRLLKYTIYLKLVYLQIIKHNLLIKSWRKLEYGLDDRFRSKPSSVTLTQNHVKKRHMPSGEIIRTRIPNK